MSKISPLVAFAENGPLASHIDNFTVRPQQQEFATVIANALVNHESLICEAATGTGKTYAYLVPALLSNMKIIISTGTKHLQDQLFHRDLPVVSEALGIPVTSALLKGRNNYLCWHRLKQSENGKQIISRRDEHDLQAIKQWSKLTTNGDLSELTILSEDSVFQSHITSTAENCLGKECEYFDDCFVFKARKKANEAELIIVNHHLLLADLCLRETGFGEILPSSDAIIFDEAHLLPELASEFFSQTLSSRQVTELINDSRIYYLSDVNETQEFIAISDKFKTELKKLRLAFGNRDMRVSWDEIIKTKSVRSSMDFFQKEFYKMENALDNLSERSRSLENCWRRCSNLLSMLEVFIDRESDDMIKWLETRGKGFILYQTPLDISDVFQARLQEHNYNCMYTSATLAIGKNFDFFSNRLGLTDVKTYTWHSPFDFSSQALLYLPGNMPDPRDASYISAVIDAVIPVIRASQGHAFLLFTSHRALNEARELILNQIDYPIMVQGDAPRTELLNRFRDTKHAVLLGTSSFWEGVDVRGQALSSVIIDKLPFATPDDPVFRARAAKMEENGQNPFLEYQLPEAIINLRQGIGRLIRDVHDYGILMVCDPRLQSKSYGQIFLNSLPELKITNLLNDVELFFEQHQT